MRQLPAQLPALRAGLQRAAAALLTHAFLREALPHPSPSVAAAVPEWAALDARGPGERGEALLAAVASASGGGEGSGLGSGSGHVAAGEDGALLRALGERWRVGEALAAALASVRLAQPCLMCSSGRHLIEAGPACTTCEHTCSPVCPSMLASHAAPNSWLYIQRHTIFLLSNGLVWCAIPSQALVHWGMA